MALPPDDLVARIPQDVALALQRIVTSLDNVVHAVAAFEARLEAQERSVDTVLNRLVAVERSMAEANASALQAQHAQVFGIRT